MPLSLKHIDNSERIKIELITHACIIIHLGDISLLCDPWINGTCFGGNWGQRYTNSTALTKIKQCSHLWISHGHSDHFHITSLRQIASVNPNIRVLANKSFNFDAEKILRRTGFLNTIPLYERKPIRLNDSVTICRYPVAGIDNFLSIKNKGFHIVNNNDCNLPASAIKSILKKIGPIDILLTNFNHAGKLLTYPSHSAIKEEWKNHFTRQVNAFRPTWVIPFASYHYYRSKYSAYQNLSHLTLDEVRISDHILNAPLASTLTFTPGAEAPLVEKEDILPNVIEFNEHNKSLEFETLLQASQHYVETAYEFFLGFVKWLPDICFYIGDLDRYITLSFRLKKSWEAFLPQTPHIETHSITFYDYMKKKYGNERFFIGGDFKVINDIPSINKIMLLGFLIDAKLYPRNFISLFVSASRIRFFWNRREEIAALALKLIKERNFIGANTPRL